MYPITAGGGQTARQAQRGSARAGAQQRPRRAGRRPGIGRHREHRPDVADAADGRTDRGAATRDGDDLVVVSPDTGRVKVAARYANALHAGLAFVYKQRRKEEKNSVEALALVGEVEGKTCVLIDDMIDTAGTMVAAAEQLTRAGAARVLAAATHAVLSGPAIDRLKNSVIEKVVVTDTLPLTPDKQIDKIEQLSVAGIIADAIRAVFEDSSVSEIFDGQNQS